MSTRGHDDACSLFDLPAQERRAMTREETETFLQCSLTERKLPRMLSAPEMQADFASHGTALPFALAVLLRRLEIAGDGLRFSPEVVLFLTSLCDSPARVVLWAYSLVRQTRRDGAVVTMTALAHAFPDGFPTDAGYSAAWDRQKLRGGERNGSTNDNWLDTGSAWAA